MSAELVEAALAAATLPCVVIVTDRSETNLRWALSSLTTNGQMHAVELTVIATAPVNGGTAVGNVTREVSAAGEVGAVVAAAEAIAGSGPPAEDAVALVTGGPDAGWDAAPQQTSVEVFASVAPALGAAFSLAREQGHLLFGFAEHVVTTTYLGSSTGLRRRFVQPTGRLELNAKSAAGGSAWVGVGTADFSDVDISRLHEDLLVRLGWSATRIDLPPGHYETLLPPSAVADLMIYLYWTAGARDAEEGRSVFSHRSAGTRVGESLSSLPLTLSSDPAYPGLECAPFVVAGASDGATISVFDNGLPLEATDWIRDGRLSELARNRAWAVRTGQQPRPVIDNLVLDGNGQASLEEMIASTSRGLLLTCLWYIREVDPEQLLLTGLTRDGVYLIEDGQVRGAVNNFRFNESPVDLLRRVSEVGVAQQTLPREWNDYFTRTVMPPLRVADFNMSTVSQAS
ncbi:MAG TPA: metallopeptidase TldD-related protein [Propionibacteriaceae bacterium]|nr:metallopeptidase TldD-related protein [Propionibacteriaceae bacterium]